MGVTSLSHHGPVPDDSLLGAAERQGRGVASVRANRRLLGRFEDVAEGLAAAGRVEDAIAVVRIAANSALMWHPGVHTSLRLEALLERIAREHLDPLPLRD